MLESDSFAAVEHDLFSVFCLPMNLDEDSLGLFVLFLSWDTWCLINCVFFFLSVRAPVFVLVFIEGYSFDRFSLLVDQVLSSDVSYTVG